MNAPADPASNAAAVVRTLRDAGHVAYFAGGCVRDRLLGLVPKDYDVATDAPPARVQALFRRTQAVGAAFGVILVRLGGSQIEVATFRSDGVYEDGRRPESVTFATAEADAQRRDFSINGLFYDPIDDRIIDYVGGRADLAANVLRAIGNPAERFAEDHLRLLRAVRFAARFGLTIEPATDTAIRAAAGCLPRISGERIADELRRILTPPTRDVGYRLLWDFGLLPALLNRTPAEAALQPSRSLFLGLAPGRSISFAPAWLATVLDAKRLVGTDVFTGDAVLADLAPTAVKRLIDDAKRLLKISNDEADAITEIAKWTPAVLTGDVPDDAKLKRFLARPTSGDARQLLDAIAAVGVAVDRVATLRPRFESLSRGDVAPTPLLTGDDLIRAGVKPGPSFKRVLDAVYDAQLNGTIADARAALAFGLTMIDAAAGRG